MTRMPLWLALSGLVGCAGPVLRPDIELDATRAALRAALEEPVAGPETTDVVPVRLVDDPLPEVPVGSAEPAPSKEPVAVPAEDAPVHVDAPEAPPEPMPVREVPPPPVAPPRLSEPRTPTPPPVVDPWFRAPRSSRDDGLTRAVEDLTRALEEQRLLTLVQLAAGPRGVSGGVDDGRLAELERRVETLTAERDALRSDVEAALERFAADVEAARTADRERMDARLATVATALDTRVPADLPERLATIETTLSAMPSALDAVVASQEALAARIEALEQTTGAGRGLVDQVDMLAATQAEILAELRASRSEATQPLDEEAIRRMIDDAAAERGRGRWPWSRRPRARPTPPPPAQTEPVQLPIPEPPDDAPPAAPSPDAPTPAEGATDAPADETPRNDATPDQETQP